MVKNLFTLKKIIDCLLKPGKLKVLPEEPDTTKGVVETLCFKTEMRPDFGVAKPRRDEIRLWSIETEARHETLDKLFGLS